MNIYVLIYRFMERIDGEHGFKLISYSLAEKIKIMCLNHMKG